MLDKLSEILTQPLYSWYELLVKLWDKNNEVIDAVNNKTDKTGDFLGTWNGYQMVETSSGEAAMVSGHETKLNFLDALKLKFVYGVTGDGLTDDTAAIQAAINAIGEYGTVIFPSGTFKTTAKLTALKGQRFIGAMASKTEQGTIINNISSDYTFVFDAGKGLSEITPPRFQDIRFECTNGIRLGDSTIISPVDQVTSQNYILATYIQRCVFIDKGGRQGKAIELNVCFRCVISENYIEGFNVGINLNGSDLCKINNNRIWKCGRAAIELVSYETAGSQTSIVGNDLLSLYDKATSVAHIISSDFNPIIRENYFENSNCDSVIYLKVPSGSGVVVESIIISDNRLETDATQANNFLKVDDFTFNALYVKNNSSLKANLISSNNFPAAGVTQWCNTTQRKIIVWENSPMGNVPFFSSFRKHNLGNQYILAPETGTGTSGAGNYTQSIKCLNNAWVLPNTDGLETWLCPEEDLNGDFDIFITAKGDTNSTTVMIQPRNDTTYSSFSRITLSTSYKTYRVRVTGMTKLKVFLIGEAAAGGKSYIKNVTIAQVVA